MRLRGKSAEKNNLWRYKHPPTLKFLMRHKFEIRRQRENIFCHPRNVFYDPRYFAEEFDTIDVGGFT